MGREVEPKKRRRAFPHWGWAFGLIAGVLAASFGLSWLEGARMRAALKVTAIHWQPPRYLTGTLVNTTGAAFENVEVDVLFYDAAGREVGHLVTSTKTGRIEPHETWHFDTTIYRPEATTCRLEGVYHWDPGNGRRH